MSNSTIDNNFLDLPLETFSTTTVPSRQVQTNTTQLIDSIESPHQMDLHNDAIEYIPHELDDSNIQGKLSITLMSFFASLFLITIFFLKYSCECLYNTFKRCEFNVTNYINARGTINNNDNVQYLIINEFTFTHRASSIFIARRRYFITFILRWCMLIGRRTERYRNRYIKFGDMEIGLLIAKYTTMQNLKLHAVRIPLTNKEKTIVKKKYSSCHFSPPMS